MSHAPDLRRIFALVDGRLQGDGRADFERHLAECPACAAARTEHERLRRLARRTVSGSELPAIDWDRMEGRLLTRIAAAESTPARAPWWRILVPAAIAAALVLAVSIGSRSPGLGEPTPERVATRLPPKELRLAGPASRGIVTLVQGRVRASQRFGEPPRTVAVSSPLDEGAHLRTSANALVAVQTGQDTGFSLAPGSEVDIVALRTTGAVLRLESGRVASRVRHLEEGQAYRVVSGDLLIEVRGTRFDVQREERTTIVSVSEGVVAVRRLRRGAGDDAVLLRAPAVARVEDGLAVAEATRSAEVPPLRGLWVHLPRGTQTALRLPPMTGVSRVEVDGIDVGTGDSLLAHARGKAEVVVYPLEGGPIRTEVSIDRTTTSFRMPAAHPEEPAWRPPVGQMDRGALSRAMASYSTQVRRCYDRRLKRVPTLRERMDLRLTIGTDGTVTNATLRGGDHDAEVSECVLTVARRWTFQAPQGGAVTVNVPFNFAPRGHAPDAGP